VPGTGLRNYLGVEGCIWAGHPSTRLFWCGPSFGARPSITRRACRGPAVDRGCWMMGISFSGAAETFNPAKSVAEPETSARSGEMLH